MIRRIALVTLWFFTGWMCAAMVAFAFALPTWIAPVIAIAVASAVSVWSQPRRRVADTSSHATSRLSTTAESV